jgi:preprotein translocase subunit SecA
MLGIVKKLFGTKQERDIKEYGPLVDEINEIYETLHGLSHDELRQKTVEFRARIAEYLSDIDAEIDKVHLEAQQENDVHAKEELFKDLDKLQEERDEQLEVVLKELLPEAFAVVKETARRFSNNETITVTATDLDRDLAANPKKNYVSIEGDKAVWKNSWVAAGGEITWNMVHYDVQLIGGMVLHDGKIAEMATGEGKTLVATLPAYLNGLSQQGVHVITVNDYLARRDAEWVGPVFEFLFVTIDCIDKYKPHSPERRAAYNCDVTYGTNNEFGFDYLRDNMVRSKEDQVQRKHHYVMIDEVDSVLIDDARTPLIISGPVPKGSEDQEYVVLKPFVERLLQAQRKAVTTYLADAKKKFKEGNTGYREGEGGMDLLRAYRALPKYRPLIKFLSEEGVKVNLQKAENYYMQEQSKNMHIADEPLLFTIDEKNRQVDLTERGAEYLAQGQEDANFFIMPDIVSGMVEIDKNESAF